MHNWKVNNQVLFDRNKLNFIKKWWVDIDKVNLLLVIGLMMFSLVMAFSSSQAVAKKISVDKLFFIKKQIVFVIIAIFAIILISFMNVKQIKIASIFGMIVCLLLLCLVKVFGSEAKGATRWIMIFGFNLQPSEFTKIFFLVFNGFLLQKLKNSPWLTKYGFSTFFYLVVISLIISQPDLGMSIIISLLWAIQLFIFGLPIILTIAMGFIGIFLIIIAYLIFPHAADRINKFLNFNEKNYQVTRSIDAYVNGGFFGSGPGNGVVKKYIPDSHTDFIFAVVAEEFGLITCLFLLSIFLVIISRVLKRALNEEDLFSKLVIVGLISQIALQTLINIGVSIGILPTKGMTLPFISYGGSSMIAVSIGFGIILALTKKSYDNKINYKNILIN